MPPCFLVQAVLYSIRPWRRVRTRIQHSLQFFQSDRLVHSFHLFIGYLRQFQILKELRLISFVVVRLVQISVEGVRQILYFLLVTSYFICVAWFTNSFFTFSSLKQIQKVFIASSPFSSQFTLASSASLLDSNSRSLSTSNSRTLTSDSSCSSGIWPAMIMSWILSLSFSNSSCLMLRMLITNQTYFIGPKHFMDLDSCNLTLVQIQMTNFLVHMPTYLHSRLP